MDAINKWLALIANFGVVVGIGFLAYETRLNTDALGAANTAQMVSGWNEITVEVAMSDDMVSLIDEVNRNGLSASAEAVTRTGYLASSMFKNTEFVYTQWLAGNIDDDVWHGMEEGNRLYFETQPYFMIQWAIQRRQQAPSHRNFIDQMIREICAEQDCPAGGRPEDWDRLNLKGIRTTIDPSDTT